VAGSRMCDSSHPCLCEGIEEAVHTRITARLGWQQQVPARLTSTKCPVVCEGVDEAGHAGITGRPDSQHAAGSGACDSGKTPNSLRIKGTETGSWRLDFAESAGCRT